ncbi:MAG: hypothetical protein JNJ45_00700 [Chthonomonas sp.]|nr:hypothetical protein [Chthonomonas sp.]
MKNPNRIAGIALSVVVIAVVGVAFVVIGSPVKNRGLNLDRHTLIDVTDIALKIAEDAKNAAKGGGAIAIQNYPSWSGLVSAAHATLPADRFTYRKISAVEFEICTTFNYDYEEAKAKFGNFAHPMWVYKAGRHCFRLNVTKLKDELRVYGSSSFYGFFDD